MANHSDFFGYDDFAGSGVGHIPATDEDKFYDHDGITEVEEEDWDDREY